MHTVDLDDSFISNFNTLDLESQEEVGLIWKSLEADAHFQPSSLENGFEYFFEERNSIFACQHVSGWNGWKLVWFLEFYDHYRPMQVEYVGLLLKRAEPAEKLPPQYDS